jgi:flagellar biosynthesis protein FliR
MVFDRYFKELSYVWKLMKGLIGFSASLLLLGSLNAGLSFLRSDTPHHALKEKAILSVLLNSAVMIFLFINIARLFLKNINKSLAI